MTAPNTATPAKKPDPMRAITPVGRLSYPHLFRPRTNANEDGQSKEKYATAIVFKPGEDLGALKAILMAAGVKEWGEQAFAEGVRNGTITLPFRTDAEAKGYPAGSVYFNCSSEQKPQIVDQRLQIITDETLIYPGVYARISVRAYAYNYRKGGKGPILKRGVSFGLQNIQKIGDGDRLDNRVAADQEFEATMAADSAAGAASLDDLIGKRE